MSLLHVRKCNLNIHTQPPFFNLLLLNERDHIVGLFDPNKLLYQSSCGSKLETISLLQEVENVFN